MKSVGFFVLKSVVFSIIFCAISALALFAYYNANTYASNASNSSQQNDTDALMKKYWSQAAEADAIQDTYREQQSQATSALKKQDELLARWELVIEHWESKID